MLSPKLALATLLGSAIACVSPQTDSSGPERDDSGRPLPIQRDFQRIVSLAPSTTELLFDLGAGIKIVGRTRWADYPPQIAEIASVGDGLSPNVELIVAARPDLVVFYASPSNETAITRLEALDIATVSLRTDKLADLARAAHVLGRLTETEAMADTLVAELSLQLAQIDAVGQEEWHPSVLILAWDNPPIVIGSESFLSEIVELAGGRNVFGDSDRPSLTTSIEAIAQRNPDIVLVASDSGVPAWAGRPEWQSVASVRERRFVIVAGSEFNRPSFRAPGAVRHLRAALSEWRQ